MKKKEFVCIFSSNGPSGYNICYKSNEIDNRVLVCDGTKKQRDKCPYWFKK